MSAPRRETREEQSRREERESNLYYRLLELPDRFKDVPFKERLSLKWREGTVEVFAYWLLHYAHARHEGIACMKTSSYYGYQRLMRKYSYQLPTWQSQHYQTHHSMPDLYPTIADQELDFRLLDLASRYQLRRAREAVEIAAPKRETQGEKHEKPRSETAAAA